MADYDKYTVAPVVWLLDLSYKLTARHTTTPSLSRMETQLSDSTVTCDTYILSNVREFHA